MYRERERHAPGRRAHAGPVRAGGRAACEVRGEADAPPITIFVCMYMCINMCIYIYIFIHTYIHTYIYIYIHIYMLMITIIMMIIIRIIIIIIIIQTINIMYTRNRHASI